MSGKENTIRRLLVVCLLLAALGLIGCGVSQEQGAADGEQIDLQALAQAMLAADTTLPQMQTVTSADEQAALNFTAFSDFDYARVAAYVYAFAKEGGTQELAVVELKDAGDAAALMNTLKKHLEDRKATLATYAPDQLSLVEHAVIKQSGRCVALIVTEKSGLVQQAFEDGCG